MENEHRNLGTIFAWVKDLVGFKVGQIEALDFGVEDNLDEMYGGDLFKQ